MRFNLFVKENIMPDQRRTFSIGRGRGTTARQVRTKNLGFASSGRVPAPARPLREDDARVYNSLMGAYSETGRDVLSNGITRSENV